MIDRDMYELDKVSDKAHYHESHTDCATSLQKFCMQKIPVSTLRSVLMVKKFMMIKKNDIVIAMCGGKQELEWMFDQS